MEMQNSSQQQIVPANDRRPPNQGRFVLVSVNLALLLMATWAWGTFGSIRHCIGYYLRGETLFVDAAEKSFGSVLPGDHAAVEFNLTNHGSKPIRVLGCYSRCRCIVPNDMPFELGPSKGRKFELAIDIPENEKFAALFSKLEIVLFTNNPLQSRIPLIISGDIRHKSVPSDTES